jgi:hypothetical protein
MVDARQSPKSEEISLHILGLSRRLPWGVAPVVGMITFHRRRRFTMPRADQGTLDQGTFSLPGPAANRQADPEAIARRAYELFQQRGGEPGHEIEDWLQAEAELTARAQGGQVADQVADIGNSPDGKPDGRPVSTSTSSVGSSGAPARKGNGGRRPQRQPQSH